MADTQLRWNCQMRLASITLPRNEVRAISVTSAMITVTPNCLGVLARCGIASSDPHSSSVRSLSTL